MSVNARKEEYEHVELFGKPALFTDSRIDRSTVPEGFHCYDLRGSDYDPGKPIIVEDHVVVNHAGSVLTSEPVNMPREGRRRLNGKLNFLGECLNLEGFCEVHAITLAPETCRYALRPALAEEAGNFLHFPRSRIPCLEQWAICASILAAMDMSSGTPGGRVIMKNIMVPLLKWS